MMPTSYDGCSIRVGNSYYNIPRAVSLRHDHLMQSLLNMACGCRMADAILTLDNGESVDELDDVIDIAEVVDDAVSLEIRKSHNAELYELFKKLQPSMAHFVEEHITSFTPFAPLTNQENDNAEIDRFLNEFEVNPQ